MKSSTSFYRIILSFVLSLFIISLINSQTINNFPSNSHRMTLSTHSVHVEPGWNLISLPLSVTHGAKNSLFPNAKSDAFIYQGSYLPIDTLENGYGFWLKFDSSETYTVAGEIIYDDTITVKPLWNIIGGLTVQFRNSFLIQCGTISSMS